MGAIVLKDRLDTEECDNGMTCTAADEDSLCMAYLWYCVFC